VDRTYVGAGQAMSAARDNDRDLDEGLPPHLRTQIKMLTAQPGNIMQLRRLIRKSPDATWVRQISLNDAVMTGTLGSLRYLVDELKVETLNASSKGYTPLQLAVIWGQFEVLVYLLSRGGNPMLEEESSVLAMCRVRQQRLQEGWEGAEDSAEFERFNITKRKRETLLEEGVEMLKVLEGVDRYGSYLEWAKENSSHKLVKRFSANIRSAEPRYQFVLLRGLALASRASLLPMAERKAVDEQLAHEALIKAKEERPLTDALIEGGFSADVSKAIADTWRYVANLKALREAKLSNEEIEAKLDCFLHSGRMKEGERRKFTGFVRTLEEPAARAPAPKPALSKSGGYPKSKAKASAPNAALLAAAKAKAAAAAAKSGAGPAKAAAGKKPSTAIDGLAMLFNEGMPDEAFMTITQASC